MIDIDYADYKAINSHHGYSAGFNDLLVDKEEFENMIILQWLQYLKQAKGIIINFKTSNYDTKELAHMVDIIDKHTCEECDFIFGTEVDENIEKTTMIISLQITGLAKLNPPLIP